MSTAWFSACRTRRSASGPPLIWAMVKEMIRQLGVFSMRTFLLAWSAWIWSGGTLTMRSAWPVCSAAIREPSSGMGRHVARRTAGLPLQCASLASTTIRSFFIHSTNLKGPVPTGLRFACASPTWATYFGASWYMRVMRAGMAGSGTLVWNRAVKGSTTSTRSMVPNQPFCGDLKSARLMRSNENFTASASKASPLWNFTPWRSLTSHTFSLTSLYEVASAGTIWSCLSRVRRVS